MNSIPMFVCDIEIGNRLRQIDQSAVNVIAESMSRIGLLQPISVYLPNDKAALLVTGAHRLAAAKKLGWEMIDVFVVRGDEIDREMKEIAENLHRAELTVLERSEQIGRWAELTAARVSQTATPLGGQQPQEKGVRKVARELGIDKDDALRAVKVASISTEAKQAARDVGLDDNRSALLTVAKETTPEAQVARVGEIAAAKSQSSSSDRMPNPPPQTSRRPSSPAEAMDLANALRVGLSALDPVIDRIGEIGEREFLRLIGESEAPALVGILRPWLWRIDSIVCIHKNRGSK